VDRADTVDNPEGSNRDRTCRWGGHGYRVHDLFLLSISKEFAVKHLVSQQVSTAQVLTRSYGVGLVLIREGSQGQNSGIDSRGYPLNPVIKAAVTGFSVR